MCQGFTRGHAEKPARYRAREQATKEVYSPSRLCKAFRQARQTSSVSLDQLVDSCVQTGERAVMSRQDEHVIRHSLSYAGQRLEPIIKRISVRLRWVNRYIGGDARQHLVA